MFLQDSGTGNDGKSLKGAFNEFKSQFDTLTDKMLEFDVQARKVVGDTFGQGAEFAEKIRVSIAESVMATAELGYTTSDYATLLSQISTNLQRNVDFSSEQLTNMMLFADAASISAEEVGKLVVGFENIGVGAESALHEMEGLSKTARNYGLNVAQYMGVIGENLKLMNQYKFQGGVEGLANMVAKSQALRININTVTTLAEKFLDPEGAIDAAASLQMMGGQLAQLGDGFQLMNLAQNDVNGLFDALVEATSASVSFNEESGQFELSALEMRRLRATAKELGVDYNELSQGAINFARRQEALSQLDFMGGVKEEDKEFLASIGQLDKTGELKFAVKRGEETALVSATELSGEEIKALRKQQTDSTMTSQQIALDQRDILTELYNRATQSGLIVTSKAAAEVSESGVYEETRTAIREYGEKLFDKTEDLLTSDFIRGGTVKLIEGMTTAVDSFSLGVNRFTSAVSNFISGFSGSSFSVNDAVINSGGNVITTNPQDYLIATTDPQKMVTDAFKGVFDKSNVDRNTAQIMGNLPKDIGNVLQNNMGSVESPSISFEDLQITHSGSIRLEGDGRFLTLDMLANNPQMLENLTNMIKQRMTSQTMGYNNA